MRYHIDRSAKTVDASMLVAHAHAVFTPGYGCRLTYPDDGPLPAPEPQTETPNYGSGFWTNDGASEGAAWRAAHGFPKDGYFASGNLGQRIYIVPSERLVVARFGYTTGATSGSKPM